jgi:hypothetical protein
LLSTTPSRRCTVAIAGIETGAGSPGISIARSLRAADGLEERLVGLAPEHDVARLRSADLGLWSVVASPAPAEGEPFLDRLREVHERSPIDVLLATRTADVEALVRDEPVLRAMGIHTFLPTQAQLAYLKGARGANGANHNGGRVEGEYAVAAVADGKGGLAGVVALRKIKAEGESRRWVGIAARDEALRDAVRAFADGPRLRGPLDLDVTRTAAGGYGVLRAEPRLPGWVHLFASSGPNLPWVSVRLALGETLEPQRELPGGTLLVGAAWEAWMAHG